MLENNKAASIDYIKWIFKMWKFCISLVRGAWWTEARG